ncbi:MAG: hypothetical protein R3C17_16540 [Planctomycetaceae bacterium]
MTEDRQHTAGCEIGEGDMGIVFVAVQSQPIKRKVALKVIKSGADSRQELARLDAERPALLPQ